MIHYLSENIKILEYTEFSLMAGKSSWNIFWRSSGRQKLASGSYPVSGTDRMCGFGGKQYTPGL